PRPAPTPPADGVQHETAPQARERLPQPQASLHLWPLFDFHPAHTVLPDDAEREGPDRIHMPGRWYTPKPSDEHEDAATQHNLSQDMALQAREELVRVFPPRGGHTRQEPRPSIEQVQHRQP